MANEAWQHDQIKMVDRLKFKDPITFDNDDTTPSVAAGNVFKTATGHSAAKSITDLDGGLPGQVVIILGANNANKTTLVDGGDLVINGNWEEEAEAMIMLVNMGSGDWYEIFRRHT